MKNKMRKTFIGILIVLVIVFVAQNTEVVQVRFLFWTVSMSRALMFMCTFLIGVLLTLLLKVSIKKRK